MRKLVVLDDVEMPSSRRGLEVVPQNANIAGLTIGYDDFLPVSIECEGTITKAKARDLERLYEGWCSRVEKASGKVAREDGEELLPIRFDPFAVSGARAHFGASRFLAAEEACRWLARELAKIPGVVRVTFGEEDVAATPKPGATRAVSAAAARVQTTLTEILGDESSAATVLGCISIRFTGEGLSSPGKVLARLIDEAIHLAGDVGSIWVRGAWGPRDSLEEVNQGRDLREKAGRALLDRMLGDLNRMPTTEGDPVVHLVLSDGPRPERARGVWKDGSRVPSGFGVQLRVGPKDDRLFAGGHMEVYLPLADLDTAAQREQWVAFGERAFEALHGTIGTFSPALWMEAIAPNDLPIELFTRLPAVGIPRLVGDRAGGFNLPELSRDRRHGLFDPPWIAWVSAPLASRVGAFPGIRRTIAAGEELRLEQEAPLAMDEARYARYRAAWGALEPLRIRWSAPDASDDVHPWRRSLDRFDAPGFTKLDAYLQKRLSDAQRRSRLHWSIASALREGRGREAFEAAEEALALGAGPDAYEALLEAVLCFHGKGKPDPKGAPKALARALPFAGSAPRILLLAAKVHMVLGDREAALAALAEAPSGDGKKPDPLEADPALAPLRDDERFRRAFGWASHAALERLRADDAKPDLTSYPKLAKAVKASPSRALFARGATKKAVDDVERALGLKLPTAYRAMLQCFDGALFHDGREVLYSASTLTSHNSTRMRGQDDTLAIGRNLSIHPGRTKGGEAPLSELFYGARARNTTLQWKTLDACLAALVTRSD